MEQIIKDYIIREFMFESPDADLTNDQPLLADGIIDSLGIFTLIAFIEQQFGIKVAPAEVVLDNFQSVNTIVNLIQSHPSSKTQSA